MRVVLCGVWPNMVREFGERDGGLRLSGVRTVHREPSPPEPKLNSKREEK